MKTLFYLLFFLPFTLVAQTEKPKPLSREEMQNEIKDRSSAIQRLYWGYQPIKGDWTIRNGDTLLLGKGSLPNKDFAFLYENPNAFASTMTYDYRVIRKYLPSSYSGRKVILKDLGISGNKKVGFGTYGMVGVGNIIRYYVELDNAIDAGEILPPHQYRNTPSSASSDNPVSVADELLKLKQLLDAGVITKEEFEVQKKKLLN